MKVQKYKISGVIRFSDEDVVCRNLKEAKQELKDVRVTICGGVCESTTKIELIDSSIEFLESFDDGD